MPNKSLYITLRLGSASYREAQYKTSKSPGTLVEDNQTFHPFYTSMRQPLSKQVRVTSCRQPAWELAVDLFYVTIMTQLTPMITPVSFPSSQLVGAVVTGASCRPLMIDPDNGLFMTFLLTFPKLFGVL